MKFVTPLEVPDSISSRDYHYLKSVFIKESAYIFNKEDSLKLEYYSKMLVKKSTELKLYDDLALIYISLAAIRDNKIEILDHVISLGEKLNNEEILCMAYLRKAVSLYSLDIYQEAYEQASQAYQYSLNLDQAYYKWSVKYFMGEMQSDFGDQREGILKLKEVEQIFLDGRVKRIFLNNSDELNNLMLADIQYSIALANYDLLNLEQALIYINKVGEFASDTSNPDYYDSYIGLKGGILTRQGKFKEGLSFTSAYILNNEDNGPDELSRSYAVQGIAYSGLELEDQALQSFLKADSLQVSGVSDFYFSELSTAYMYLLDYYKSEEDAPNQIKFLNKIIVYDQATANLASNIGQKILKEYSIPQLVAQKESLIQELKQKQSIGYKWGSIASLIAIFGIVFSFLQFRKRVVLRKRFNSLNNELLRVGAHNTKKFNIKSANPPLSVLKAKHIEKIAIGLEKFEKEELFIKTDVSLKSLAKQIGTNSSYLSKYVNSVKSDNFSTYVNDLRIQYVLHELYASKKLNSYTIQAIANEIGFTTAKSFSTHFKRVTGLSVSYFLKQLDLQNKTEVNQKDTSVIDFIDHINKTGW